MVLCGVITVSYDTSSCSPSHHSALLSHHSAPLSHHLIVLYHAHQSPVILHCPIAITLLSDQHILLSHHNPLIFCGNAPTSYCNHAMLLSNVPLLNTVVLYPSQSSTVLSPCSSVPKQCSSLQHYPPLFYHNNPL